MLNVKHINRSRAENIEDVFGHYQPHVCFEAMVKNMTGKQVLLLCYYRNGSPRVRRLY